MGEVGGETCDNEQLPSPSGGEDEEGGGAGGEDGGSGGGVSGVATATARTTMTADSVAFREWSRKTEELQGVPPPEMVDVQPGEKAFSEGCLKVRRGEKKKSNKKEERRKEEEEEGKE